MTIDPAQFAAALAAAGMPPPWRIVEDDPAHIVATGHGAPVLQLDPDCAIDDDDELARRALAFVAAVNAAAGFRAEVKQGSDPAGLTPSPQPSEEPA